MFTAVFSGTQHNFRGNETYFKVHFLKPISCQKVNGCSYKVAAALFFLDAGEQINLTWDNGFYKIGSLTNFILISMQIVGPSVEVVTL